jgi:hypothetical protein
MFAYLPLIQKILLEYMSKRSMGSSFSFNFKGLGLTALSLIMGLIAFIFLLLALQTYASALYGVPMAWLITAGVTLLLAIIIHCIASISRKRHGLINHVKEEVQDTISPLYGIIEELAAPIKDHPVAAVILAGLAGVVAAEKMNTHGTE